MAIHLHPTAELAPRALLPGDPGRALLLAQELLDQPRMFNHHRGLWGYSGVAIADGEPLTIQSTGMGGPSAAIVLEELATLGVERVVRVGTCGGLSADLGLGDLLVATEALAADGASRALGASDRVAAHPALAAALTGRHRGTIVSSDLFYDPDESRARAWEAAGVLAVDMAAAALLRVAEHRGVAAACLLVVSDLVLAAGRDRIDDEALAEAAVGMGRSAVEALA